MVDLLKVTLLSFLFLTLVSCEMFRYDNNNCREVYFNNKIQFKEYYSGWNYSKDSLQYYISKYSFYEDSTFSYFKICYQNNVDGTPILDTITMLNGKFTIYQDPGLPWYVLDLNANFIYEKEIKDTINGILHFTTFIDNKFNGFENKFFTNTSGRWVYDYKDNIDSNNVDRCFSLNKKIGISDNYCSGYYKSRKYWYLDFNGTFCMEELEEIQ